MIGRILTQVSVRLRLTDSLGDTSSHRALEILDLFFQLLVSLLGEQSLVRHEANIVASEQVNPNPPVSVVIVSYNTRECLRRCLESLPPLAEVIVVDNSSTDGSREMLRGLGNVKLIENDI